MRLRLLDAPGLTTAAGQAVALAPIDAALLAYVTLQAPVPRDRVTTLLWPDRPLAAARNNLRQRLHRLQLLSAHQLFAPGAALVLGAEVTHDLSDPLPALRADPLALPGRLLGELYDDGDNDFAAWLATERLGWRARMRDALLQLATEREAQGRLAEALVAANRLVANEPLLEHATRVLMRLHHRRGDRGAALDAFDRCAAALHTQLGATPSDETVQLAAAIRRAEPSPAPPVRALPLALRHPPRTVGRQHDMAAADRRWQAGGVVLLTAEAGAGKTRLFDELCLRWPVRMVCRAQSGDTRDSLSLLGHVARALLPQLPPEAIQGQDQATLAWLAAAARPPSAPQALNPDRLCALLRDALQAARAAGADSIGIDDLHWADNASLAVLSRLWPAGREAVVGVRWLLTCRRGEVPPPLQDWLAAAEGVLEPEIPVPPLDAAQLCAFVESLNLPRMQPAAWAEALAQHCGGNPLSVLQVLRALHDRDELDNALPPQPLPVPQETLQRLSRRLEQAGPLVEQLAFVAALAGPDFDADLAGRLTGRSASELLVPWRRLEDLGVLHGAAFSHDLIRQAMVGAVPAPLAPGLHREIGAAMTAAGRAPARRAQHWEAAGEWRHAADDHLLAADAALRGGLQPEARDHLLRAADHFARAAVPAAAFDARWRAGRLILACDSAAEALSLADGLLAEAGDDRQRCLALCLRAAVRTEQHDVAALDDAARALALALPLNDPALLARVQLRQACALQLAGQPQQALDLLRAVQSCSVGLAEDEQREAGDTQALALAAIGRRTQALQLCLDSHHDALARHDLARAAERLGTAAVQLCYLCRPLDAIQACEKAVALARRAGIEVGYVLVDEMTLAGACQDVGRYGAALALAERVTDELYARGYLGWAINAENSLAGLFVVLGRADLARRRLADAPADAPTWARALRRASQARLAALRGESPLPALRDAMAMFDQGGAMPNPYALHRTKLELARWSAPDTAVGMAAACRDWAAAHEHLAMSRLAGMVEIDALLRGAAGTAAADRADQLREEMAADADGGEQAYGYHLPELWWALCRAWDGGGRIDAADAVAVHAAAWIHDRAVQHVPDLFREAFLTRNPTNRAVLARARAAGVATPNALVTRAA